MQLEQVLYREDLLVGLCDKEDLDLDLKLSPARLGDLEGRLVDDYGR